MAVPDARMEFQIGGSWAAVTDDVRKAGLITHTRGRQEGGARVDPGSASFTVESPNGLYSNRNPNSPNFGKLGRNTPARLTVAGPSHLAMTGTTLANTGATTPDTAALDIVGDIDIRFDATLTNWLASGSVELCGKGAVTGNQRSWLLLMRDRRLRFEWSTAGTATTAAASTAEPPVPPSGRITVRVVMDVNVSGTIHTVTFYTGNSVSGPWTQLGEPSLFAGTTSIFNSTAPVRVGDGWGDLGFPSSSGKVHAAEIRNGIDGTAVAAPDFTAPSPGATSFTDSTGTLWTIGTATTISDRWQRFTLSVPEWPPSWHASGHDVKATLQAAGTMRRLGQGAKALESTLRRRIPSYSPLGYWPMEEEEGATQAYSPIPGVRPATVSGFAFASDDGLAGSGPLPAIETGARLSAAPLPAASASDPWQIEFVYRIDTAPAGDANAEFLKFTTSGTGRTWRIGVGASGIHFDVTDADGASLESFVVAPPTNFFGVWNRFHIHAVQNGGNVDWEAWWITVGGTTLGTTDSFAGTVGRVTRIAPVFGSALEGMRIGHLGVFAEIDSTIYNFADIGFTGETAGARITRLSTEEDLPISVSGTPEFLTLMGPQRPNELLTLLGECEASDGGILYEDRESTGLRYRDRASLYNQTPKVTIPYGQLSPPLTPVDDDQAIRNDITRQRIGGSSARVVVEDGPLSVQAPPLGVGVYDESVSLSLHDDAQPLQIAGWAAHLGTWDEARYPSVRLYLHNYPALIPAVLALDVGDVIRITDLPGFLPPGPVDLMVMGYREDIGPFLWDLTLFCIPAGPWEVGVRDDTARGRRDTAGSELAVAVNATATSWSVATTKGQLWTTAPADMPFDVVVGGERVTVTAISGATSPQTFTTVRSVNGIVKAHTAATDLRLVRPTTRAL